MSDLISRQAAIDALSHMCSEDENGITISRANVNSMLRALPSAHPDLQPTCNNLATDLQPSKQDDLISRQDAIDALFGLYEYQRDIDPTEAADLVRQGIYLAEKKIERLPSAQPDLDEVYAHAETEAEARYHAEIVRCKDCKYYQTRQKSGFLPQCCWFDVLTKPNDFCSNGRKENR